MIVIAHGVCLFDNKKNMNIIWLVFSQNRVATKLSPRRLKGNLNVTCQRIPYNQLMCYSIARRHSLRCKVWCILDAERCDQKVKVSNTLSIDRTLFLGKFGLQNVYPIECAVEKKIQVQIHQLSFMISFQDLATLQIYFKKLRSIGGFLLVFVHYSSGTAGIREGLESACLVTSWQLLYSKQCTS